MNIKLILLFSIIFLGLVIFIILFWHKKAFANLIPRKVLFGNPIKMSPRISPNGKKLLYIAPVDGIRNIWIKTLGQQDDKPLTIQKERDITNAFWSYGNDRVFYFQDKGGNENWLLYVADITTNEAQCLTPFEGVRVGLVSYKKHLPDEMLIMMNKRDPRLFDVYKLDLKTNEFILIAENPGRVEGWVPDYNNKIRAARVARDDAGYDLIIRDREDGAWRTIAQWNFEDGVSGNSPISFSKDGRSLYVIDSRGSNTDRLVSIDTRTGGTEVLLQDTEYDVSSSILINQNNHEIQYVEIYKAHKEMYFFDQDLKKDYEIMQTLDCGEIGYSSRSIDDRKWVINFVKDDGPISFWFFDRDNKKGEFLFDAQPDLKKYKLAKMKPMFFKSRDGLTIHGYLTCPIDRPAKNLPLVLYVHGGPWHRDYWGYDSSAQWLANRGHSVLQVNYRGSTGYGKEFVNASNKEWGGKMHDDLVDAVKWAVDKGIADPKKIAIYGGSYGGYAALVGATFTPDLFCCSVDIVGPSNLITLMRSFPPYWKNFLYSSYKRIGNPDTEQDFLKSRSPLFKVQNIKIPILIAQGANDPRVKQAESEQIVSAMKEKGIAYEYLLFPDEGHGFVQEKNRLKFWAAAEKFLAKHLGGKYEEA